MDTQTLDGQWVVDFGAGTKSLEQPCIDMGLKYFSIDIDPKLEPDMVADIGKMKAGDIPVSPWVIWFSPPCTKFSVASIGKYWNEDDTPKTEEAREALEFVEYGMGLIKELGPEYWFMENPRGKLRKLISADKYVIRHQVSYCRYGDTRMKPTDIWTNSLSWVPRPMCRNGHPDHVAAPRGSRTGTQGMSTLDAGRVPYALLREILESCKNPVKQFLV